MGRVAVVVLVVLADAASLPSLRTGTPPPLWIVLAYLAATALLMVLRSGLPAAVFTAALALAIVSGGSYALLVCTAYTAGNRVVSRRDAALIAGGTLACFAVQAPQAGERNTLGTLAAAYVVLVGLPMVVGRYLAQHGRLVAALDRHNRQLRFERELLAEQERLRERLRIARDMHDSLGHRLGLVSVQAAALEVAELPDEQRRAVRRLADTARGAMDELHDLVGTLRQPDEPGGAGPGPERIGEVVEEFRAAGTRVTLNSRGDPRPLPAAAGQAAYRVVEEGLTNAAKHAPDEPVTVSLEWERDALLLTVANSVPAAPPLAADGGRAGFGLAGLAERVRLAGGLLRTDRSATGFRVVAMLPADPEPAPLGSPRVAGIRATALTLAAAALVILTGPASLWSGGS